MRPRKNDGMSGLAYQQPCGSPPGLVAFNAQPGGIRGATRTAAEAMSCDNPLQLNYLIPVVSSSPAQYVDRQRAKNALSPAAVAIRFGRKARRFNVIFYRFRTEPPSSVQKLGPHGVEAAIARRHLYRSGWPQ
jgi:hypothetical protein